MYVSPRPEALPEALQRTVATLAELGAPTFKVGDNLHDLLRPDKLVIYFGSREELDEVAERLVPALAGLPAQGVPFTAALGGDGLVSWGIDPPPEEYTLPWLGAESWRIWITNRLATALVAAREAEPDGPDGIEGWRFALERLRLEGVDTGTWAPTEVATVTGSSR